MKNIMLVLYRYLQANPYHYYEEEDWSPWHLAMIDMDNLYDYKSEKEIKDKIYDLLPSFRQDYAEIEFKIIDEDKLLKMVR